MKDYADLYFIDEPVTSQLLAKAERSVRAESRAVLEILIGGESPSAQQVNAAIRTTFQQILFRHPTLEETARLASLHRKLYKEHGARLAAERLLMAIYMQPEALFREELGSGSPDNHGRQWEHAARAASLGDRYFKDDELALHANFADRSLLDTRHADYLYALATLDDYQAGLAPVGSYRPNPWGIHDIYGNVWELTHQGVLCGGGWVSLPEYCRAGVRKPPLKYPSDYVGFRIVLRPRS